MPLSLPRLSYSSIPMTLVRYFLVNGEWSSWREWSRCSSSCDSGVRQRKRTCDDPKPSDDGLPCYGRHTDYIACVMPNVCEGMI